jgi:hypothetical protein
MAEDPKQMFALGRTVRQLLLDRIVTYCADYLAGFIKHGNRLAYIGHDDLVEGPILADGTQTISQISRMPKILLVDTI